MWGKKVDAITHRQEEKREANYTESCYRTWNAKWHQSIRPAYEPKKSCTSTRRIEIYVAPRDACGCFKWRPSKSLVFVLSLLYVPFVFYFISSVPAASGGGTLPDFLFLFYFPCFSVDHKKTVSANV